MNRHSDPEAFQRYKRLALVNLVVALVIQIIVLLSYIFKEGQVTLAFPMVLGIVMTIVGIGQVWLLQEK